MTYSYTQISQYLTCPRRYRYRYLDGRQEKDVRAVMLFRRAFLQAIAAVPATRSGGDTLQAMDSLQKHATGLLRAPRLGQNAAAGCAVA